MSIKTDKINFQYIHLNSNFPIFTNASSTHMAQLKHNHNILEIFYCVEGSGQIMIENNIYNYSQNSFAIIPKNTVHKIEEDETIKSDLQYLFLDCQSLFELYLPENIDKKSFVLNALRNQKYLFSSKPSHLTFTIKELFTDINSTDLFKRERIIFTLISLMMYSIKRSGLNESLYSHNLQNLEFLKAVKIIEQHYQEKIKISDIAKEININESYLRRIFKKAIGVSPLEFLNEKRINYACSLLMNTDENILDIAYSSGFLSISSFNRNFIKITSKTPTEYRSKKS